MYELCSNYIWFRLKCVSVTNNGKNSATTLVTLLLNKVKLSFAQVNQ
jgi:hypothetical protein